MVKTVFLDFGGCIDAPGIHTRTLFWDAFLAEGLISLDQRGNFQDAYTLADRQMMRTGEAISMGLHSFNRHNAALIGRELRISDPFPAADRVTDLMRAYIEKSRSVISGNLGRFEMGLISNFTGNLECILDEFQMKQFFASITESYYAGASKPDLAIFHSALAKHKHAPELCVYVGDNPVNDIAPAKSIGMRTALIHPPGQRKECGADFYIEDLEDLFSRIQSK